MNVDPAAVNTILLTLFGIGGSVLVFRYIGPILSTQEKHRVAQDNEITKLRAEMVAAETERKLLSELVTQRAQVDDLGRIAKTTADDARDAALDSRKLQQLTLETVEKHGRVVEDAHQKQVLVMTEMVSTLRSIDYRMNGKTERRSADRAETPGA